MEPRPKWKIETTKLLEENIGKNLCSLRLGNGFLDMTPKAWETKEKYIYTLNLIKIKNFCASKDTTKKMKRQCTEWEKIFANHVSNEGIVSRYIKNIYNNKKTHDLIEK